MKTELFVKKHILLLFILKHIILVYLCEKFEMTEIADNNLLKFTQKLINLINLQSQLFFTTSGKLTPYDNNSLMLFQ